MKAWKVYTIYEDGSLVIFAETSGKAKAYAMSDFDEDYTNMRATRLSKLDKYYRGSSEMDWYNDDDRIAMVKEAGFHCEGYEECTGCCAKEICEYRQEHEDEKLRDLIKEHFGPFDISNMIADYKY